MTDTLWLEVNGLTAQVLTGIYSEETHLPQPLRISVRAKLAMAGHYDPTTPLGRVEKLHAPEICGNRGHSQGCSFRADRKRRRPYHRHLVPAGRQDPKRSRSRSSSSRSPRKAKRSASRCGGCASDAEARSRHGRAAPRRCCDFGAARPRRL